MGFLILIAVAIAGQCPLTDMVAVGLDAYSISVEEGEFFLEMTAGEERLVNSQGVQKWREILLACEKEEPQLDFLYFISQSEMLYSLGEDFDLEPIWALLRKHHIRRAIRDGESQTALAYAAFLRSFQRATGVAVKWDPNGHPLAKGMISTARGSDLVADYIEGQWSK